MDIEQVRLPPPGLFSNAVALSALPFLTLHPNLQRLHATTVSLIKSLKKIAALSVEVGINFGPIDPAKQEALDVTIEAARNARAALRGRRAEIFERDLSRYIPGLAPKYIRARDEALSRIDELLQVLGFFLGSDDDAPEGHFVPAPPPFAPGASIDLP